MRKRRKLFAVIILAVIGISVVGGLYVGELLFSYPRIQGCVTVSPLGAGNVTKPQGTGCVVWTYGTEHDLQAKAFSGWKFYGWSVAGIELTGGPRQNPSSVVVTNVSSFVITAVFVQNGSVPTQIVPSVWTDRGQGKAPLTSDFQSVTFGGNRPYTYAWSFGDGGTSSFQNATHVYTQPGKYHASLTVTDAYDDSGSQSMVIIVGNSSSGGGGGNPTINSISANPRSGRPPLSVNFNISASGGTPPYTYYWAFGDGMNVSTRNSNISHVFNQSDVYFVQAYVNDSTGDTSQARSVKINVLGGSSGNHIPPWWPPGLHLGWANENDSIVNRKINAPIQLSSQLNVSAVSSNVRISYVAFNQSVLMIAFANSTSPVSISMSASQSPIRVYDDNAAIGTWSYSSGVLRISGNSHALTLVFGTQSQQGAPGLGLTWSELVSFDGGLLVTAIAAVLVVIAVLGFFALRRRR